MKHKSLIAMVFLAFLVEAKNTKPHESGTLLEMESVECGLDENSGKSFAG